jgi:hypothetical protein
MIRHQTIVEIESVNMYIAWDFLKDRILNDSALEILGTAQVVGKSSRKDLPKLWRP